MGVEALGIEGIVAFATLVVAAVLVFVAVLSRRVDVPIVSPADPWWPLAWACLLLVGLAGYGRELGYPVGLVAPLLSPLFPGLQLAGVLQLTSRALPCGLLAAVLACGGLRFALETAGAGVGSHLVALTAEPGCAFLAAGLLLRAGDELEGLPLRVLVPIGLVGVGVVEAVGATADLLGWRTGTGMAWLAVGAPLVASQIAAGQGGLRRVLRRLREAEDRFRLLTREGSDLIAELDGEGRIRFVSPNIERILGVPADQLVDRDIGQLLEPLALEAVSEATRSPDPTGPGYERTVALRDARGRPRRLDVVGSGFEAADGTSRRIFVARDVTRRWESEAVQRVRQVAIEQVKDGVVVTDLEGHVIYANPAFAAMMGTTLETLERDGVFALAALSGEERLVEQMAESVRSGETWDMAYESVWRDGTKYQRIATVSPVRDAEGTLTHCVGVFRDITEKARLDQRLGQLQKLEGLRDIAAGIAHDFNNLLTVIQGNAQIALEGADAEARELLEPLLSASEHAAELTRQLLSFAGRGDVHREPLDLSELARADERLLRSAVGSDVQLRFQLSAGLPSVQADRSQLQQVLMNLVLNAGEASEGGTVTVETRLREFTEVDVKDWVGEPPKPGRYVELSVLDEGCGMDEETLERIFDPYFSTKFQGRGLGLAAVLGIVRSHRGALRVGSWPGMGSCFSILLGAGEARAPGLRQASGSAAPAAPAGAGRRVLVVDDEPAVLATVTRFLESRGFAVVACGSGEQALEALDRSGDVDVVLADLTMPGMGGEALARAALDAHPEVPIVLMSGHAEPETVSDLLDAGMASFVEKPFGAGQIARVIGRALAGSGGGVPAP